jgi:hypothetical protein
MRPLQIRKLTPIKKMQRPRDGFLQFLLLRPASQNPRQLFSSLHSRIQFAVDRNEHEIFCKYY